MINAKIELLRVFAARRQRLERIERRVASAGTKPVKAIASLLQATRAKMTRESRSNLLELGRLQPELARTIIKRIRELPRPIESIIVPATVLAPENREGLRQFSRFMFLPKGSAFDLRQAGLKAKPVSQEVVRAYEPIALADYISLLAASSAEFKQDQELANLFLFKVILRLRVTIYRLGETRSKLKREGRAAYIIDCLRAASGLKDLINDLTDKFPWGENAERKYIKDKLELAVKEIAESNYPAANAVLVPLTERLGKTLFAQQRRRLSRGSRTKDWKIALSSERGEKGMWILHQTGYRRTKVGMLHKAPTRSVVSTAKLLSMIDHELDHISAELTRNEGFLTELRAIRAGLPGGFDQVFGLYQTFTHYFAWHKEKACVEIEAALQLLVVGSDQAVRLADSLLSLATRDLELRQAELKQQHQAMINVKDPAESKIAGRLIEFAVQAVEILSQPGNLVEYSQLARLERRLGGLLGSYFKEEMREPWLKRAKSRVVGLKKSLPKLADPRMSRGEKICNLKKSAMFILLIGLFYENRKGGKTSPESYLARYKHLLDRFDKLR